MKKITLAFFAMLLAIGTASAQSANQTSTVNFTGTVSPSVDLRIVNVVNTSSGVTNVGPTNATSATIDFGELSPNRTQATLTNGHSAFTVRVALRSNIAYRVQANSHLGGTINSSAWELDDIGFGVLAASPSGDGARVASGAENVSLGANVSSDNPSSASTANGIPAYTKTLSDIREDSDIITGSRISLQGNVNTNNNAIIVPLRFASAPQFFDPETRTGLVQFDIFPVL